MRDLKRWLPLVIVGIAGALALRGRVDQLETLGQTLRGGRWQWIALALGLQTLAICNQPALYQSLYEMLGLPVRWRDLAPVVWAGHFVNVATPSAGLGGTALLLADGRRRGFSGSRVALANTLYFGFNFAWFALLLAFGLWALRQRGQLRPFEVAAATTLFSILLGVVGALIVVSLWPQSLEKPLVGIARSVNFFVRPFLKRDAWPVESARGAGTEAREAMMTLRLNKGRLGRPLFHTFWVDALEIGVLAACLEAFPGAGDIGWPLVVAAYAVATLFLVVSVTPQGLGVVEGVLGAVLVSFGAPVGRAALVVIAFRGLSFWLPLAFGFFASKSALSSMKPHSNSPSPQKNGAPPAASSEDVAPGTSSTTSQTATDGAGTSRADASNAPVGGRQLFDGTHRSGASRSDGSGSVANAASGSGSIAIGTNGNVDAALESGGAGVADETAPLFDEAQPLFVPERAVPPSRFRHWRSQLSVGLPAFFVALMGCVNLVSAATPGLAPRVQIVHELPFHVGRGSHLATTLAGFALLLLAQGLWRRKTASWALAIGVLILSVFTHLLKGLDWEEATLALSLAIWLWVARRQFFARSDAPSIKRGVATLALAFVFTLLYGAIGFYFLDSYFRVHYDVKAALAQTVAMFTSFSDPGLEPITGYGAWFGTSIYLVAASTIGYALFSILRPVVTRPHVAPEVRERAQTIVETQGDTAFAFCALMDDKTYWFSPGGSVVAYAVVGRAAIAMGDPIGPRADRAEAIRGFVEFARRNDWRPAFYEVYDDALPFHRAAGLQTLRIAHDAVVDLKDWTLLGGVNKSLRSVVNTIKNKGYHAVAFEAPLSNETLELLREVSDEWLAARGGGEKTFSLGGFEDDYVKANPAMVIFDESDRVMAFANIVSCYQAPELSIDLMRRRAEARSGAMELLFTSVFEWAKVKGYERFNIGPSPFAMVGEHAEDPTTEKAIHFIYEHIDQFYNFKGLHAFKEKFKPRWRALYLTYDGTTNLPLVAASIVRADSGENSWWGFLKGLRDERG